MTSDSEKIQLLRELHSISPVHGCCRNCQRAGPCATLRILDMS